MSTLLSLSIGAALSIVPVTLPCGSHAVFAAVLAGNGLEPHRFSLEALGESGEVLATAWAQESYVPAVVESVGMFLGPSVTILRCIIAPEEGVEWSGGRLTVTYEAPELRIELAGDRVVLDWFDPVGCWQPQKLGSTGWQQCTRLEPVTGEAGYFRLAAL